MPRSRAIVVADAHLGASGPHVEQAFCEFLATVPQPGDQLVINGDLFDFWFEYERVIPRSHFRTLASLHATGARGVSITFVGGNHDRWGGEFLTDAVGVTHYASGEARLQLAGRRAYVHHGDGLTEGWSTRLLHRAIRHPGTIALFRAIHPDLGLWIADRFSGRVADFTKDRALLERAPRAQEAWARALLESEPEIELVVLGHTHRAALVQVGKGYYLNPGAFLDGGSYAVVTENGIALEKTAAWARA